MKERALVLGGGGPAGIAWEVGVCAGLAAEGFEVARADSIIGTSAGAFVGAQLSIGFEPQRLAELHQAVARAAAKNPAPAAPAAPVRINQLLAFMERLPRDAAPSASLMAEMGALALREKTVTEAEFLATFGGMFGPTPVWSERYACCSVNARDGSFKLWTREDGVQLANAVAASCSVPGVFPPVTLGADRWIDGGVRSWTNGDYAAGYARVLMLAVVLPDTRALHLPVLAREQGAIEAAAGKVELMVPDDASLLAFGENRMAPVRSIEIIDAGLAQGRREAARIKALWS